MFFSSSLLGRTVWNCPRKKTWRWGEEIIGGWRVTAVSENNPQALSWSCATNYRRLRAGPIFLLCFFLLPSSFFVTPDKASVQQGISGGLESTTKAAVPYTFLKQRTSGPRFERRYYFHPPPDIFISSKWYIFFSLSSFLPFFWKSSFISWNPA